MKEDNGDQFKELELLRQRITDEKKNRDSDRFSQGK